MKSRKKTILILLVFLCILAVCFRETLIRAGIAGMQILRGKKTVTARLDEIRPRAWKRLQPAFDTIGVHYPPDKVALIGLKMEQTLEVWVSDPPKLLKTYQILKASGDLGPKLTEGDRQVPEGIYRIESLNPNSLFHLALRLNYPNAFDQAQAKKDGRNDPGSDIMIHGKRSSIGCLAMGDEAIEELFLLVTETDLDQCTVILSPVDFRRHPLPANPPSYPAWTETLYQSIQTELNMYQQQK